MARAKYNGPVKKMSHIRTSRMRDDTGEAVPKAATASDQTPALSGGQNKASETNGCRCTAGVAIQDTVVVRRTRSSTQTQQQQRKHPRETYVVTTILRKRGSSTELAMMTVR